MSPDRRGKVIALAQQSDFWIIEDDYDGEFRYHRRPLGTLLRLAP
jgi:GntR family transcriptional regulator/MocR family aminotransferase